MIWDFPYGGHLVTMEIKFGFAILAYYTWWIIVLLCLTIVLFKLITNKNFSIGFRVGIQTDREDRENLVLEPILLRRAGQQPAVAATRNNNNANNTAQVDNQVDNI